MAELREAHLRYLLAIYELGKSNPDVGTQAVAKALNCSKASVTKMMAILMDMNLLVREKYGKIYLTDTGFLLAKDILYDNRSHKPRFNVGKHGLEAGSLKIRPGITVVRVPFQIAEAVLFGVVFKDSLLVAYGIGFPGKLVLMG